MNFYASSLFPERCDRLLFVIVTMPESVHLHDYSIPVDDMDNHLGTWSLLRLFPTFSRSRPPDNRITHAGGGKGDRPLVIPCQDSKKEPHHFTQSQDRAGEEMSLPSSDTTASSGRPRSNTNNQLYPICCTLSTF